MNNKTNFLGAFKPKVDVRDYKFAPSGAVQHAVSFKKDIPDYLKDQGSVCSCVPSALTYQVEKYNKKQTGNDKEFSIGFVYGYRPTDYNQTSGMYMRDALKTIQTIGNVPKTSFDYNEEVPTIIDKVNNSLEQLKPIAYPNRISTYFSLDNEDAIKTALESYDGYVSITIDWYSDNTFDVAVGSDGSVYSVIKKGVQDEGGHALTIYGWNEYGWLIVNTWGVNFGQNGYAVLPFDYGLNEAWGVTDDINITVDNGTVVVPATNIFLDMIFKFINFIINLFKRNNQGN